MRMACHFSRCRRFFSPRLQRWQKGHSTPFVQPFVWKKAQGLHLPTAWPQDPTVGRSAEPSSGSGSVSAMLTFLASGVAGGASGGGGTSSSWKTGAAPAGAGIGGGDVGEEASCAVGGGGASGGGGDDVVGDAVSLAAAGVVERQALPMETGAGAGASGSLRTCWAARASSSRSSPDIVRGHSVNIAFGLDSGTAPCAAGSTLPGAAANSAHGGIGKKQAPPTVCFGMVCGKPSSGESATMRASSASKSSPLSVRGQNFGFCTPLGDIMGLEEAGLPCGEAAAAPAIICSSVSPLIVFGQSIGCAPAVGDGPASSPTVSRSLSRPSDSDVAPPPAPAGIDRGLAGNDFAQRALLSPASSSVQSNVERNVFLTVNDPRPPGVESVVLGVPVPGDPSGAAVLAGEAAAAMRSFAVGKGSFTSLGIDGSATALPGSSRGSPPKTLPKKPSITLNETAAHARVL
mmetsp:Transcript_67385/g.194890  ORF Transcript_67385/g.194890 Transcript_67385/m.194890 type:complete len:460 (-) Transcript_67385:18-1397(-)